MTKTATATATETATKTATETAIAVRVTNVSKRYRIGVRDAVQQTTLLGSVAQQVARPFKNFRRLRGLAHFSSREGPENKSVIWALRNISLEVPRGQTLGIVGNNGSGKSTLLKIISAITRPTRGQVEVVGRSASLIGVGAGMNNELTGEENIYLNGVLLGMSRAEIRAKFDEIVAFAELEKFLHTPLKRYSSGMRVRLGFAVAVHLEPEILILDEALAAGDVGFREKCKARMREIASQGRTVIMVSHILQMLSDLCDRCVWVSYGEIVADGDPTSIIEDYTRFSNASNVAAANSSPPVAAEPPPPDVREQAEAWYTEAVEIHATRQYEQTITLLDQALEQCPDYVEARYLRGSVQRERGAHLLALADFDLLLAAEPTNARWYADRGQIHQALGDLDAAIGDYNRAVDLAPKMTNPYFSRGCAYMLKHDYQLALDDFARVLADQPNRVDVSMQRGIVYRWRGQFIAAIADFNRVLARKPKHLAALHNRGLCYLAQDEPTAALADFEAGLRIAPHDVRLHNVCIDLYLAQQQHAKAANSLNYLIEDRPRDFNLYQQRGLIYYQQGKPVLARRDFDQALALNPELVQSYYHRGLLAFASDDIAAAAHDFAQVVAREPMHSEALYHLSLIAFQQGEVAQAYASIVQALAHTPAHLGARYQHGRLLLQQGNLDAARQEFDYVLAHDPTHVGAYRQRGRIASTQNRLAAAVADLDRALRLLDPTAAPFPVTVSDQATAPSDSSLSSSPAIQAE